MPDVIEAARSGRARCRRCGEGLSKGDPRFGEEVDNTFGDGKAMHWFHLGCAAEKRPAKLLAALAGTDVTVEAREELEAAARGGVENPSLTSVRRAERAKTGRARCQQCREPIGKGTLRVAVEREDELATASVSFVHARCAAGHLGTAGLSEKLHRLSHELSEDDLAELDRELAEGAAG